VTQDTCVQSELANLACEGKVNIMIDEMFPFTTEGVQQMLRKIQAGHSCGKNVVLLE
jgi:hypothetical protein